MTLEQQLLRWVDAGLLTTEQARRIRAFEHANHVDLEANPTLRELVLDRRPWRDVLGP